MDQYLEAAQAIVARVPAWQGREIRLERIAGLTNTNYRVTVAGESFALRVSGPNAARLGINRAQELAALQAAAQVGLGPEVIAFFPPEGHLITRWVTGQHWTAPEFRTPERVRLLAETARRIHSLPPNGATFSPFQRALAYLATARDLAVPLPADLARIRETMRAIEADQRQDPDPWPGFCHNDLVSVNYLFATQTQSLKVLDWEFAGWGDRYYDLATIVYTHDSEGPLPPELEETLLAAYFGTTAAAWQWRRLGGMKYMLLLFSGLWGLVQFGMQQAGLIPAAEDFDYREFAENIFARELPELQAQYLAWPARAQTARP